MKKYVFITGGVISSLGKGIVAASIARLLKDQGLKVNMLKCDPYLNVDPGTMSPNEHGEVFVTYDGGETDLDIGHYERFLSQNLTKNSSFSSGKLYSKIIDKERNGDFLGKTVQIIPHVTDEIKNMFKLNAKDHDIVFIEIGGTVGDIESQPYLEAIRQMQNEENVFLIHCAYVPYLKVSNELKTKPVQHSVKELQSYGVKPDMVVCRSEVNLSDKEIEKIALFCNIKKENVIQSIDLKSVYELPLKLKEQNVDRIIANYFNLNLKDSKHQELQEIVKTINADNLREIRVGIFGKYHLDDAYISVIEAIKHAGLFLKVKPKIDLIDVKKAKNYQDYDAIIVPGGFGDSGTNEKMEVIRYARENNVPFLGICLGMQLSIVEFARNVCNLDVVHGEFSEGNQIITLLKDQDVHKLGGTLRLGEYECMLEKNSLAHKIYNCDIIKERHRHRYEFNNEYKNKLIKHGMKLSGINPQENLLEIIEIPENKYFIASQFHPELSSKLTSPNPLFVGLLKACIEEE